MVGEGAQHILSLNISDNTGHNFLNKPFQNSGKWPKACNRLRSTLFKNFPTLRRNNGVTEHTAAPTPPLMQWFQRLRTCGLTVNRRVDRICSSKEKAYVQGVCRKHSSRWQKSKVNMTAAYGCISHWSKDWSHWRFTDVGEMSQPWWTSRSHVFLEVWKVDTY